MVEVFSAISEEGAHAVADLLAPASGPVSNTILNREHVNLSRFGGPIFMVAKNLSCV